jgi:hypothetical protein
MRTSAGFAVFFFFFWIFLSLEAQGSRDTTRFIQRWKLHFQSRFSFVEGKPLSFWIGSVGYAWGPYQREITLGYHWLGQRGTRQLTQIDRKKALDSFMPIYPTTEAGFINLGYWHIMHNSRRWKAGIPLEIGIGKAQTIYYSFADKPLLLATPITSRFAPVQVGGYGEWKATRWVGLGVQCGYRYNLTPAPALGTLNGMYYRLRVLVYPATFRDGIDFVFRRKPLPSPFFKKE